MSNAEEGNPTSTGKAAAKADQAVKSDYNFDLTLKRPSLTGSHEPFFERNLSFETKVESFSRSLDTTFGTSMCWLGGNIENLPDPSYLRVMQVGDDILPNFYFHGEFLFPTDYDIIDASVVEAKILYEKTAKASDEYETLFTAINRKIVVKRDLFEKSYFKEARLFRIINSELGFDFLAWSPLMKTSDGKQARKEYFRTIRAPYSERELLSLGLGLARSEQRKPKVIFYRAPVEWLKCGQKDIADFVAETLDSQIPDCVEDTESFKETLVRNLEFFRDSDPEANAERLNHFINVIQGFTEVECEKIWCSSSIMELTVRPTYAEYVELYPHKFVQPPEILERNESSITLSHKVKTYECEVVHSEPLGTQDLPGGLCSFGASETLARLSQRADSLTITGELSVFSSEVEIDNVETTVQSVKSNQKGTGICPIGNWWSELVFVSGTITCFLFGKKRPSDTPFSTKINNHILGEIIGGTLGPGLFLKSFSNSSPVGWDTEEPFADCPQNLGSVATPSSLSSIVRPGGFSSASCIVDFPENFAKAVCSQEVKFHNMQAYLSAEPGIGYEASVEIFSGAESGTFSYDPTLDYLNVDPDKSPGENLYLLYQALNPDKGRRNKFPSERKQGNIATPTSWADEDLGQASIASPMSLPPPQVGGSSTFLQRKAAWKKSLENPAFPDKSSRKAGESGSVSSQSETPVSSSSSYRSQSNSTRFAGRGGGNLGRDRFRSAGLKNQFQERSLGKVEQSSEKTPKLSAFLQEIGREKTRPRIESDPWAGPRRFFEKHHRQNMPRRWEVLSNYFSPEAWFFCFKIAVTASNEQGEINSLVESSWSNGLLMSEGWKKDSSFGTYCKPEDVPTFMGSPMGEFNHSLPSILSRTKKKLVEIHDLFD